MRCIHARLLGPSSLQCPVTFICGCANINLSSPLILSLSSPLILSSYPHCSLVRCIHARLLGPSSLQCLVTFICGCAIINLSSPENYYFSSKVALPKVRSCKHDSLLSLHFFFNSDCPSNLLFTANHTFNELFWTEDDNQDTEIRFHDSGEQIRNEILRNTTAEMESQKWTNWGWGSGQTGGGARSALATT